MTWESVVQRPATDVAALTALQVVLVGRLVLNAVMAVPLDTSQNGL
jgi:hypothetical protein